MIFFSYSYVFMLLRIYTNKKCTVSVNQLLINTYVANIRATINLINRATIP